MVRSNLAAHRNAGAEFMRPGGAAGALTCGMDDDGYDSLWRALDKADANVSSGARATLDRKGAASISVSQNP
jgi:hypothetical protein